MPRPPSARSGGRPSPPSATARNPPRCVMSSSRNGRCRSLTRRRARRPRRLDRIGVLGGGTMGAGIAAACLLAGLGIAIVERDDQRAALARGRVSRHPRRQRRARPPEPRGATIRRGRIDRRGRISAPLAECDLIIEAVFSRTWTSRRRSSPSLTPVTRPDADPRFKHLLPRYRRDRRRPQPTPLA